LDEPQASCPELDPRLLFIGRAKAVVAGSRKMAMHCESMAVPAAVRNRRLVIVPEHTRELGGFMNLKSLQRKAKQLIDRRGGTDSLKADAEELKDIAKGPGSVADKAKRAGDALKDPGAKGPDTPASRRPPATDTPAPTAEPAAPPAPESDAPGTPKPGTPPGA
jgi:hypothetical protein